VLVNTEQAVAQIAPAKMLLVFRDSHKPAEDIFFEVRSLIWPDRSQNGTISGVLS
jgi:hypothetical protein